MATELAGHEPDFVESGKYGFVCYCECGFAFRGRTFGAARKQHREHITHQARVVSDGDGSSEDTSGQG